MNKLNCFFVTDLHGNLSQYHKLFDIIRYETPKAVFIGGDLLPNMLHIQNNNNEYDDFVSDILLAGFNKLKSALQSEYPKVFIILGNDDPKIEESKLIDRKSENLWHYAHNKKIQFYDYTVYGYSYVPPSPFQLKDWEKYDVSRYVDPGCISPEEGYRSIKVDNHIIKYSTIKKDLERYRGIQEINKSIFLFHSPPYKCNLDRAALDGKFIDHVPLDVHVGSIAIKDFIEENQPYLTLHGHIHESYRLTGEWEDNFGKTKSFSAAHDGKELAIVRFDLNDLSSATREHI